MRDSKLLHLGEIDLIFIMINNKIKKIKSFIVDFHNLFMGVMIHIKQGFLTNHLKS